MPTAPAAPPPEVETPVEEKAVEAAAEKSNDELFKWSSWVHVGAGADECDKRFDPRCKEEGHFHAWVRLPNPFQIRDITEKARAAKARRLRLLRDESSDPRVILESELDDLRDGGESLKDILADEIIDKDFPDDYSAAIRAVDDQPDMAWEPDEDGPENQETPKLWANIDQDREEYQRQLELDEEARSEDYPELEKTVAAHSKAIEAEMAKIQEPRKKALLERPMDELIDVIRRDRMEQQGTEAYLHTFNTWQWYACTYKPRADGKRPKERVWSDINAMKYESDGDVILSLRQTFEELEARMARSRQAKNS